MRWEDFRRSDNVEDVRDGGGGGGGIGFPIPGGGGGIGIGTLIVLGLIGWALGIDPRILIGGAEIFTGPQTQIERQGPASKGGAPSDRQGQFVAAVLGSTEDVWTDIFRANGQTYRVPRLRLYAGVTGTTEMEVFARLDDGAEPGVAQLALARRFRIGPGEAAAFPTFAIHRPTNVGDDTALIINVYSEDLADVDRHRYVIEENRATPYRGSGAAEAEAQIDLSGVGASAALV